MDNLKFKEIKVYHMTQSIVVIFDIKEDYKVGADNYSAVVIDFKHQSKDTFRGCSLIRERNVNNIKAYHDKEKRELYFRIARGFYDDVDVPHWTKDKLRTLVKEAYAKGREILLDKGLVK